MLLLCSKGAILACYCYVVKEPFLHGKARQSSTILQLREPMYGSVHTHMARELGSYLILARRINGTDEYIASG